MSNGEEIKRRFGRIQRLAVNGNPYWSGRELMAELSYADWRNFVAIVEKAKEGISEHGGTSRR